MEIIYHDPRRKSEIDGFLSDWLNGSKTITCKTSGSTGEPKNLPLLKTSMRRSAKLSIEFFKLTEGKSTGLALSCSTIAGKMQVVRAIEGRLKLHVLPLGLDPLDKFTDELDFITLVAPQILPVLSRNKKRLHDCTFLLGGGEIPFILENTIANQLPYCYQSYGMTETCSHVAIRHLNGKNEPFKALPNISFDVDGKQLIINAYELLDESLKTNDEVELINQYSFRFLGRLDFVINSGGVKLHPEEIEQIISDCLDVEFMVAPVPDEVFGSAVGLLTTCTLNTAQWMAIKNNPRLTSQQKPRFTQKVEQIDRTESGKVARKKTHLRIRPDAWKPIL